MLEYIFNLLEGQKKHKLSNGFHNLFITLLQPLLDANYIVAYFRWFYKWSGTHIALIHVLLQKEILVNILKDIVDPLPEEKTDFLQR